MKICIEKDYSNLISKATTRLFPLKPVNISSSLSESIPSYIMRLAMAHSVTVGSLVQDELIPRLKFDYMDKRASEFYHTMKRLNSSSLVSRELIRVLEELTGIKDLRCLNFYISDRFSIHKVFRDFRAWCPHCLEELKSEGEIIYEPLIWNFSIVEYCKKHKYPLQTKCPNCGKQMHILTANSIIGYCSKCRCWLGSSNNYPIILHIERVQWHWWVYDNISELIAELPKIPQSNDKNIIAINLKEIANHFLGSLRKFSQFTDISYKVLIRWIKGTTRPNLNLLLDLGYCINLTLRQIAVDQLLLDKTEIIFLRQPEMKRSYTKRVIDWELCEQRLNVAILDNITPSISEIARQVSVCERTLCRHFPKKVAIIINKRRESIRTKRLEEM